MTQFVEAEVLLKTMQKLVKCPNQVSPSQIVALGSLSLLLIPSKSLHINVNTFYGVHSIWKGSMLNPSKCVTFIEGRQT